MTGSISCGQAVAVYTSTGFEIMGTPLGPREALRIEQKLDMVLDIGFDIAAKSALKYRNGEMTLDEFRDDFLAFSPKVKAIIKKVGQLSPPAKAEGAHQSLVGGLAKCNRAIDLMDSWFDTRDQGTKEAAVLLVAGCEEDVTASRNELATLAGGD